MSKIPQKFHCVTLSYIYKCILDTYVAVSTFLNTKIICYSCKTLLCEYHPNKQVANELTQIYVHFKFTWNVHRINIEFFLPQGPNFKPSPKSTFNYHVQILQVPILVGTPVNYSHSFNSS